MLKKNQKTHEQYIEELKDKNVHFDKFIFLSNYINAKTKIHCKCKVCGYEWDTLPVVLLRGSDCKQCFDNKRKLTHEEFLSRIGDNIQILTKYATNHDKVLCRCKIDKHEWMARPADLMRGIGCPKCKASKVGDLTRKTHDEFLKDFSKLNKNNISILGIYKNNRTKIKCICNNCNTVFYANPKTLLKNSGCPICFISNGESIISNYLNINNINYVPQKRFYDLRGVNGGVLSYDFYLPDYNILIEYQGKQHYCPVDAFGGEEYYKIQIEHDNRKRNYAKSQNMRLLEICYVDYNNIEQILSEKLNINNNQKSA